MYLSRNMYLVKHAQTLEIKKTNHIHITEHERKGF